jgi:hypothetical protein
MDDSMYANATYNYTHPNGVSNFKILAHWSPTDTVSIGYQ